MQVAADSPSLDSGGNRAAGAGHKWSEPVFRAIAALAVASASAHSAATLTSTGPWWERVTVLVADNGEAQSCRYESSLQPNASKDCTVDRSQAAAAKSAGAKDQFTRITFERRFSPGAKPDMTQLQPAGADPVINSVRVNLDRGWRGFRR